MKNRRPPCRNSIETLLVRQTLGYTRQRLKRRQKTCLKVSKSPISQNDNDMKSAFAVYTLYIIESIEFLVFRVYYQFYRRRYYKLLRIMAYGLRMNVLYIRVESVEAKILCEQQAYCCFAKQFCVQIIGIYLLPGILFITIIIFFLYVCFIIDSRRIAIHLVYAKPFCDLQNYIFTTEHLRSTIDSVIRAENQSIKRQRFDVSLKLT